MRSKHRQRLCILALQLNFQTAARYTCSASGNTKIGTANNVAMHENFICSPAGSWSEACCEHNARQQLPGLAHAAVLRHACSHLLGLLPHHVLPVTIGLHLLSGWVAEMLLCCAWSSLWPDCCSV